ncbi:MAG: hypothetical protein V4678_02590 [Patescibacteria group bacterium]
MATLHSIDTAFISFARTHYQWIARTALFVIFFYFGFLKLIGLSPADDLALGFADKMGMGVYAMELFYVLAAVECAIGILMLMPKLTRLAILIMALHMILVSSPLVLYLEAVWTAPFVPNLEGQYIIKNAALVALALGLVAATRPLAAAKR